jgi:cytochrome c oxidase assembly factor CtaG
VLAAWNVEPILVAVLGVAGVVYLRGWRRLRARRPGRIGMRHLVAFLAGLGTLFVALASPLDTLADRLLAVHMAPCPGTEFAA